MTYTNSQQLYSDINGLKSYLTKRHAKKGPAGLQNLPKETQTRIPEVEARITQNIEWFDVQKRTEITQRGPFFTGPEVTEALTEALLGNPEKLQQFLKGIQCSLMDQKEIKWFEDILQ